MRWKIEYPDFFEFHNESMTNIPKLCEYESAKEKFLNFLKYEEFQVREFFNFSANSFDLRKNQPEYIKKFVSPDTQKEIQAWERTLEENIPYPHRLFN